MLFPSEEKKEIKLYLYSFFRAWGGDRISPKVLWDTDVLIVISAEDHLATYPKWLFYFYF